jgi:DNA polymerase-3 subunit beta
MQLTLSAKPLAAHLKSVLPAVDTRSGLPQLSGVRLEARDEGLIIEATDLELTARRTVRDGVTVEGEGSVVAPARALIKAVAAMDEPDVTLASAPDDRRASLQVRAGSRSVILQGWRPEEWPSVPGVAGVEPIACLDSGAAADALERAALCASGDEARPVLTSIALYFEQDPPCLEVVATDSYRLGVTRIGLQSTPRTGANPLLVPARAIRSLAKQLRAPPA